MPVHAEDRERPAARGVEVVEARQRAVVPLRLVVPVDEDGTRTPLGDDRHRLEQLGPRSRLGDLGCLLVLARAGQVDVRVDEPGQDGRPRELDHPVGLRRIARPHPLHVTVVDEQPLPHSRVRERVHAGGSVEGPHGRELIRRAAAASRARARRRRPLASASRHDPGLRLVELQPDRRELVPQQLQNPPYAAPGLGAPATTSSTHRRCAHARRPEPLVDAGEHRVREHGGGARAHGEAADPQRAEPLEEPPDRAGRTRVAAETAQGVLDEVRPDPPEAVADVGEDQAALGLGEAPQPDVERPALGAPRRESQRGGIDRRRAHAVGRDAGRESRLHVGADPGHQARVPGAERRMQDRQRPRRRSRGTDARRAVGAAFGEHGLPSPADRPGEEWTANAAVCTGPDAAGNRPAGGLWPPPAGAAVR